MHIIQDTQGTFWNHAYANKWAHTNASGDLYLLMTEFFSALFFKQFYQQAKV